MTTHYVDTGKLVAEQRFSAGTPLALADYVSRLTHELEQLDAAATTAADTLRVSAAHFDAAERQAREACDAALTEEASLQADLAAEKELAERIAAAVRSVESKRVELRRRVDEVAQLRAQVARETVAAESRRKTSGEDDAAATVAGLAAQLESARRAVDESWSKVSHTNPPSLPQRGVPAAGATPGKPRGSTKAHNATTETPRQRTLSAARRSNAAGPPATAVTTHTAVVGGAAAGRSSLRRPSSSPALNSSGQSPGVSRSAAVRSAPEGGAPVVSVTLKPQGAGSSSYAQQHSQRRRG
jgi:hypothetical protein